MEFKNIKSINGIIIILFVFVLSLLITSCSTKVTETNSSSYNNVNTKNENNSAISIVDENNDFEDKEEVVLLPIYQKNVDMKKWGFVNKDGISVGELEYDWIEGYQDNGLTKFTKNNLIGVISRTGKIIIEANYQYIYDYSEGICIAVDGKKYIAFNEIGEKLFETNNYVGRFNDGLSWYQDNQSDGQITYGFISTDGSVAIKAIYSYVYDFNDGKAIVRDSDNLYAVIDKSGNVLYQSLNNTLFGQSDGIIVYFDNETYKYGYLNINGEIITEAKFDTAEVFVDGLAIVSVNHEEQMQKSYGLINEKGEYVLEPQFSSMNYLGEGMYSVSKDSLIGVNDIFSRKAIMNSKGEVLTDFLFYDIGNYRNGLISVSEDTETFFIDVKGEYVSILPKIEGTGIMSIENDVIIANVDDEIKYFRLDGSIIWESANKLKLNSGLIIETQKYKPDRCLMIRYPKITNMIHKDIQNRLNLELKEYFVGEHNTSRVDDNMYTEVISVDYSIIEVNKLLIIQLEAYVYPLGAAHPLPYRSTIHINSETGKLYTIADLFLDKSDYKSELAYLINKEINNQNEQEKFIYESVKFEEINEEQNFKINNRELVIYYQPYEIAPYAAGFPEFLIEFSEIEYLIDKQGGFWNTFNKVE